jgi:hypothetical protein
MESYNPNESMIPAVGGNITPMSGGGIQEGGAGTTLFGLRLEEFTNHMREAFTKIDKTNTYTSSITAQEEASLTTKLYTKVLNGEIKSKLKITSSEGGGIVTGEKGAIQKFVAYLQKNLENNKEVTGDIKIQDDKLILTLEIPVAGVEPATASASGSDAAKPASGSSSGSTPAPPASDAAKPASAAPSGSTPAPPASASASGSGSAKSATATATAPAPPAPPASGSGSGSAKSPTATATASGASASGSGSTPAPPASGSGSGSSSTPVPVNQTATAKAKGP